MGSQEDSCSSQETSSSNIHGCFGILRVDKIFLLCIILDLALLSLFLTYTISNLLNGESIYNDGEHIFTKIVPYTMLLPLLTIQGIWLCTCLTAVLSMKPVLPYLQLPYLISSGLVLASLVWLIVRITGTLMHAENVTWVLLLSISTANLLLLEQFYFLYIKTVCFKLLIRKRKLVSTVEKNLGKLGIGGLPQNDQFDTYSTKSTVIANEDFFNNAPQFDHIHFNKV